MIIARVSVLPSEELAADDLLVRQYSQWGLVARRFLRHRMAVAGACVVVLMAALALFGPFVSPGFVPFDPVTGNPPIWALHQQNIAPQMWPPHWRFLMGTDLASNPVISYVLEGGRPLLLIGILGALIASVLGAALGSLAGYSGGVVDAVLMRIVDAFLAVPFLLLLILFSAQLTDRGPLVYAIMFGLLGWPGIARLVRGYMLSLREREFAEAARALGASSWGIILRHLLPNALDILVVSFTLNIAIFIVTEATLDYLNAGTAAITWGKPLQQAFAGLMNDNWWVAAFPAVPIIITALGFNFLGDGLRDALDATSPTALITASRPLHRRERGPLRKAVRVGAHHVGTAWLTAHTSVADTRRTVRQALLSIPGVHRVQSLDSRSRQYRAAPWPIRIGPIAVVTLAMGIAVLYGHSQLIYSPNYDSPATYAPTLGNSEYGAVPGSTGGWDVLSVDRQQRVAYERIDPRGTITLDRELAPGDESSKPSLARGHGQELGAWIGKGGSVLYSEALSPTSARPAAQPLALTPPGGVVQNPDVVAVPGGFDVLFGWDRTGSSEFDIYLASIRAGESHLGLIRIVRSGDDARYPRAILDGSGHLDVIYLRRYAPGQYRLLFQRFSISGAPVAAPQRIGSMSYVAQTKAGCTDPNPTTDQWAIDLKRAAGGSVWATWATGDDCVSRGISGINTLWIGHWSAGGKSLMRPTPIDKAVDPNAQSVALASTGDGGILYYPQPATTGSYLAATRFNSRGPLSRPQRIDFSGGGSAANPHAATIAGRPVIIWERARLYGSQLVGTSYHPHAPPDLLTRLGLNIGSLWGNIALVLFGSLGGGIILALINVYLLAPLIALWLLIRRLPPLIRWPLFLTAIAALLAYVFAWRSPLPDYVLVITALGYPYAWLAVAAAVFVAGWSGMHLFARQESAMRATATALIGLYFVAVLYAVMYIEGQLAQI